MMAKPARERPPPFARACAWLNPNPEGVGAIRRPPATLKYRAKPTGRSGAAARTRHRPGLTRYAHIERKLITWNP